MEHAIALVALTAMEIVLGIDNIVFIAILVARLPAEQQATARRLGLALAMLMRIGLLLALTWILRLDEAEPLFRITSLGIPEQWLRPETNDITWRNLILLGGGLFLIGKSVHEIHVKLEGHAGPQATTGHARLASVLVQIIMLDIVFSLDSVITAVGMAQEIWVMIVAVVLAVGVMLLFAARISSFVARHPTIKMLALSFLILIGVILVAEGIGTHIDKGYIYFAMAFALGVEFLNLKLRGQHQPEYVGDHKI